MTDYTRKVGRLVVPMLDPARRGNDRFGLPLTRSLLTDTPEHEATVRSIVQDAFAAAVLYLGEEEARDLFKKVSAPKKKRRGKDGPREKSLDVLAIYDKRAVGLTPTELNRLVGQIAREHFPPKIEGGLDKNLDDRKTLASLIRRLKRERDKQVETARHEAARREADHRLAQALMRKVRIPLGRSLLG